MDMIQGLRKILKNAEWKKKQKDNNKISLKKYYEDKNLMINALNEKSFKNTIEHITYIKKVRKVIILSNLREAIL
jgi:hypothetical protein